jgi:Acetyltransferase (isoleucine patch superfamily)
MEAIDMTEEEKIFARKMFDPRSQELRGIKHTAHLACQKYNILDELDPTRPSIIKEFIGKIGETYYFQGPIQFNYGCHTYIGENFFTNFNLTIMDDGRIYIGDNVCFGPNVSLMATTHPLIAQERMGLDKNGCTTMAEYADEIDIGNNVWIACNATILGGVHIGDNVVIGAGSVVTKDIPNNYLAFGNPCHPIREITELDSKKDLILESDKEHFKYNLK